MAHSHDDMVMIVMTVMMTDMAHSHDDHRIDEKCMNLYGMKNDHLIPNCTIFKYKILSA